MKRFTKKDVEIIKQVFDYELLDHLIVTELSWHAKHAEDSKDREALKIASIYFRDIAFFLPFGGE